MSNKNPQGTAGKLMADYVQRLLKKQWEQGKIPASQIEGNLAYHQLPPGSTNGGDPTDPGGGTTTILSTPTGPAGGDLEGTYPASIEVIALRGRIVEDVTPVDGGVLVYDLETGHWVPGPPPSGGGGVTDEQIDDRVAALIAAGTGISVTYDDAANTLTIATTVIPLDNEALDDRVNALLVAGTGITKTYDDAANTLTIATTVVPLDAEAVDDRVNALLVAGTGITKTYDDAANTLTLDALVPDITPVDVPRVFGAGYVPGALAVANDVGVNLRLDADSTLSAVRAFCKTAATGSGTTIDVKRSTDGVTFATVLATPLALASGSKTATVTTFPDATLDAGDYIRLDVLSIPSSGAPPSDVTVQLDLLASGMFTVVGGGGSVSPEDIDDRVNALIVAGTGITKTYDDAANTLTLSATGGTDTHTVGDTPPTSPMPGDIWLDTSGDVIPPSPPAVITSGLILGYGFDEGSGQTLNDLSTNNYDAVLGSTASVEANDPDWITAGLDFVPDTSDIVTAAGVPDTDWIGALTVMVVARIDTGGVGRTLLTKGTGNVATSPIELRTDNVAAPPILFYRGSGTLYTYTSGSAVWLGQYACYAITFPSTDITAVGLPYLNGIPQPSGAGGNASSGIVAGTSAPVVLGRNANAATQMDGVLSYLLVYNRALSAAEIATNYGVLYDVMVARGVTMQRPMVTDGLIHRYAFSEGTGQNIADTGPDSRTLYRGSSFGGGEANEPDWVTAGLDFVSGNSDICVTNSFADTGWLGALTVMIVCNIESAAALPHLISKHGTSMTANIPITLWTNASPSLRVIRGNASGTMQSNGPVAPVGSYCVISITYPDGMIGSTPTFYVNTTATAGSTPAGSGTNAPATGTSEPIRVGRRADGTTQMDGVISYILVYSRELSAVEIAQNYAALQAIMAVRGVTLP
jgi:Concanavalin A-like lectin/glucanases superfamily